jgi:hypothetical protein
MITLFPHYDLGIKTVNGKSMVFDPIRKKYLVLTPEEWVRQQLITYLQIEKGYPKTRIVQEANLKYEKLQKKRSDILIANDQGQAVMIIECKRPEVRLDQTVVDQVFRYNKTLKLPFVFITNGREMFGFRIINDKAVAISLIPEYKDLGSAFI